ncbi:hypothetical protein P9210_12370, partial [Heyndrickxia coagulans]|nr:hypothetical protein [Heyndrickxia coagulans]
SQNQSLFVLGIINLGRFREFDMPFPLQSSLKIFCIRQRLQVQAFLHSMPSLFIYDKSSQIPYQI